MSVLDPIEAVRAEMRAAEVAAAEQREAEAHSRRLLALCHGVVMDPQRTGPLPPEYRSAACCCCKARTPVWAMISDAGAQWDFCAACYFYESAWGRNRAQALVAFVSEYEADNGKLTRRPDTQRLSNPQEIERLLHVIRALSHQLVRGAM